MAQLSERLRADGVETILDRHHQSGTPEEGWQRWMIRSSSVWARRAMPAHGDKNHDRFEIVAERMLDEELRTLDLELLTQAPALYT